MRCRTGVQPPSYSGKKRKRREKSRTDGLGVVQVVIIPYVVLLVEIDAMPP